MALFLVNGDSPPLPDSSKSNVSLDSRVVLLELRMFTAVVASPDAKVTAPFPSTE
jgi:hypothetical protein